MQEHGNEEILVEIINPVDSIIALASKIWVEHRLDIDDNRDDSCCELVREHILSMIPNAPEEVRNSLRELSCAQLREQLEEKTLHSPPIAEGQKEPERHVSSLLKSWDDCLASRGSSWVNENI